MLDRRTFLIRTGLALGTGVLAAGCRPRLELVRGATAADLQDWRAVRGEFNLSRDYIHLTGFLLASPAAGPRGDRDPSPGAGRKPGELLARPWTAPRSRCGRCCRRIPCSGPDRDRLDRQHHHGAGFA